jgi:hypothetical protein
MLIRTFATFAVAALAVSIVAACSDGEKDESSDDALTRRNDAGPGGSDAGANGSLKITRRNGDEGDGIMEIVVLSDVNNESLGADGGYESQARILASTRTGLCDRIDDGIVLEQDETIVSVRVNGAKFVVGKTTIAPADGSQKPAAASLAETNVMCVDERAGDTDKGSGTLNITGVGAIVKGSMDLTFKGARVAGTFEAKACPKKTYNVLMCPFDADAGVEAGR